MKLHSLGEKQEKLARSNNQDESAYALMDAIAQRVIRQGDPNWDWEHEAALCECGLLLTELPRPLRLERIVVTLGRPMPVQYDMSHVHVADQEGNVMCPECASNGEPCGEPHAATMCDTPQPQLCGRCAVAPALPEQEHCLECRPYEEEWDRDLYYGIYL